MGLLGDLVMVEGGVGIWVMAGEGWASCPCQTGSWFSCEPKQHMVPLEPAFSRKKEPKPMWARV